MLREFDGNTVILEFVPPEQRQGREELEKRLLRLEKLLLSFPFSAVNIPEIRAEESRHEGGVRNSAFELRYTPREIAREIQQRFQIPAIVNHVVAVRSRTELVRWFRETHEDYQVSHFVLVGGSSSENRTVGPSVAEANEIARTLLPIEVSIGNICIPGRSSGGKSETERMKEKAGGGVDFFTTQIQYHPEPCIELLAQLTDAWPQAVRPPLLISVCPVKSSTSINFLRWLGVEIADALVKDLTSDREHVLERSIQQQVYVWQRIREYASRNCIEIPLGLNIAPVGRLPKHAVVDLATALVEVAQT